MLAANVMDLLDATIVNVAAPSIHRDLGGGANTIQWLSAGYTLAFAVLLIAGARLGDILGRRRLFLVGSAGFTLFSAACAVAPTIGVLIAFRALQGGFGALMIPQGFGLMKQVFDDEAELGKAFGLFGPATGLPMLAAPIVAGALIDANLWGTGWRLVFLINVPIGALTLPLAFRSLPRGATHPESSSTSVASGSSASRWSRSSTRSSRVGPTAGPPGRFAMLAAGAILLVAFLLHERRRSDNPLIEPTLLTNRTYLERHRRRPRPLRRLRRAAALRLALRPARRRLVTDPRRPDADADGRRIDSRDGRLLRGRQAPRTSPAPHRDPAHRRRRGRARR